MGRYACTQTHAAGASPAWRMARHTSHVTRHTSHVTRHTHMQEHKLSVRHLLLQNCALPQLWSCSDDKTVKVWAATDDVCGGSSTPSSLLTITLSCVALVCEAVGACSAASGASRDDDVQSVWLGCDDNVIRVWSSKRRQLTAELKHHKVCRVCAHQLHHPLTPTPQLLTPVRVG